VVEEQPAAAPVAFPLLPPASPFVHPPRVGRLQRADVLEPSWHGAEAYASMTDTTPEMRWAERPADQAGVDREGLPTEAASVGAIGRVPSGRTASNTLATRSRCSGRTKKSSFSHGWFG
jgi:hypothetical protein